MNVRNFTPPHLQKRPCRMCGHETKALVNGQIQMHPVCQFCRKQLDAQFKRATMQRARQEA